MGQPLRWLPFALLLLGQRTVAQQALFPEPLSPRLANYAIAVTMNDSAKSLTGREVLTWRNASREAIPDLRFHLYLNAFRNARSTFLSGGRSHRGIAMPSGGWGWIDVTSMRTGSGEDLTGRIEFIHPDTGNEEDRTVFRVPLPRPLAPGATLTLTIEFNAQLPKVFARTGTAGDFVMAGQWFPKIGVWESAGWNCHEFHPTTEFYADFGVYDVAITLPERYVVGATGVRRSERGNGDGTKTVRYHAEDVHDFAWAASPRFVEVTAPWRHVTIRALMQPENAGQADRHLQSAAGALEQFDRLVGPYPYSALTIVDPSVEATGAGGMEYPTLITTETFWGLPRTIRIPELVTVHEFGHQYWYGMSASNEFEEPWLDEGVNQYYEGRVMNALYGEKTSVLDLCGLRLGDMELIRFSYAGMENPRIAPPATLGWKFPRHAYSDIVYNKTALTLQTLEGLIGTATMDSAMRTFFRQWRFRHPSARDFVAVFNDVVPALHGGAFGRSMEWYFDQTLFGTAVCDYAVTDITSRRDSTRVRSTVSVERLGDMVLPVDLLVTFEDGTEVRERWRGDTSTAEFSFSGDSRVRSARIDPDGRISLDMNRTNNSMTTEPSAAPFWKYFAKVLFWMQNLIQLFAQFS